MYNIEEIIIEKYLEGKIYDDKFVTLYSEATLAGVAAGVTAGLAIVTLPPAIDKKLNGEIIEKFKNAKSSYNDNLKDATKYIKNGDINRAKERINSGLKDIEICESIIKNADYSMMQWLSQGASTFCKAFWTSIGAAAAASLAYHAVYKKETDKLDLNTPGGTMTYYLNALAAKQFSDGVKYITAIAITAKKITTMIKYNKDSKDITIALNSQRADMLAHMDRCKKKLKTLESSLK